MDNPIRLRAPLSLNYKYIITRACLFTHSISKLTFKAQLSYGSPLITAFVRALTALTAHHTDYHLSRQKMAPYIPIVVVRSDGQLSVITKSGAKELNEPTEAQQSDVPDAKGMVDYYKKLDPDEPKAVDWRRKLGGMLMHVAGEKEHEGILQPKLRLGFMRTSHI